MTTLVITMAGRGSRFLEAGYPVPKYRIDVHGKSLLHWSLDSLSGFAPIDAAVFVVLAEDQAGAFIREECAASGIADPRVIELADISDGQATSALLAMDRCVPGHPVAIFNIDTHVRPGALQPPVGKADGHIPCFRAAGDHWSFVRMDDAGTHVVEVREKQRISELATIGLYWFASPATYTATYQRHFTGGGHGFERGEAYIAPMYNTLIAQGGRVCISEVDCADVVPLGTPLELERFARAARLPA